MRIISGKYIRDASLLSDLSNVVEQFVLKGFRPSQPLIGKTTAIRTLGSCFARHVAGALDNFGVTTRYLAMQEAINSPIANRTLFEYVQDPSLPYAASTHKELFNREDCALFRSKIPHEDVFIFTLGVAPCFFFKGTDVPSFSFDPNRPDDFEFRFTSVEQNVASIAYVVEALRKLNPTIKIVLTVSPVPLNRVFGMESAVVADCVSKSTLRVAAFNYLERKPADVYYWPSFEIVRWLGAHLPPVFGADDGNLRHVNKDMVSLIVKLFLQYYCEPDVLESASVKTQDEAYLGENLSE